MRSRYLSQEPGKFSIQIGHLVLIHFIAKASLTEAQLPITVIVSIATAQFGVTGRTAAAINTKQEEGAQPHPDTQEIINECVRSLITV